MQLAYVTDFFPLQVDDGVPPKHLWMTQKRRIEVICTFARCNPQGFFMVLLSGDYGLHGHETNSG
jgi:hypothetical protein